MFAVTLAMAVSGSALWASEMGKPGGTLVMVSTQVPRHFNPAVQSGIATMAPGAQIFAMLVRADENWNIKP